MPFDDDFTADGFWILEKDNDQLRLVWGRGDRERRTVVLHKHQLPAVLRELQKQTEGEARASTDFLGLLNETAVPVVGLGFLPEPDNFYLKAFVDLPEKEKGFAVSLSLSKADVATCASAMAQWLQLAHPEYRLNGDRVISTKVNWFWAPVSTWLRAKRSRPTR